MIAIRAGRCEWTSMRGRRRCRRKATHVVTALWPHETCWKHALWLRRQARVGASIRRFGA